MKLAFVVQRYGASIAGGSEAHCRQLAERLSPSHDITVLTTCATDYVTWANALPSGETREAGVRVIRFPVVRPRQMARFGDISDEVFSSTAAPEREEAWFRENGPDTPALIEYLRQHGRDFDLVLFWTFRYSPSYFGLPLVADRAVLIPTAEEDPAIHLDVLQEYFRKPAGYIFLTPEEQAMVSWRAGRSLAPATTIGIGLDAVTTPPPLNALAGLGLTEPFVLYLGRVDRNKGCDTLIEYFGDYLAAGGSASLVLAGPQKLEIPAYSRIRALGYVSDDIREALLARAALLVVPSPYESLSIVLLEAWNHGLPALVNARCRVLKGQVRRADGGLYYQSSLEFGEALTYLLEHPDVRNAFGRQGRAYVDREYRWPVVLSRVETLLTEVRSGRR